MKRSMWIERNESRSLKQHIHPRIGNDLFFDPVTRMFVDQAIGRHTVGQPFDVLNRVALLFGKKVDSVTYNESEVADSRLVNLRIVDFIDDSVAKGEPNVAGCLQRSADA